MYLGMVEVIHIGPFAPQQGVAIRHFAIGPALQIHGTLAEHHSYHPQVHWVNGRCLLGVPGVSSVVWMARSAARRLLLCCLLVLRLHAAGKAQRMLTACLLLLCLHSHVHNRQQIN